MRTRAPIQALLNYQFYYCQIGATALLAWRKKGNAIRIRRWIDNQMAGRKFRQLRNVLI